MLLIDVVHRLYPNEFAWTGGNQREPGMRTVDRLAGTDQFRLAVDAGRLRPLLDEWDRQAEAFRDLERMSDDDLRNALEDALTLSERMS